MMNDKPKKGMKVYIPETVFNDKDGKKVGYATIIDIEGTDIVVKFEDESQGVCQIYEIPMFQTYCGEIIEKHMTTTQYSVAAGVEKTFEANNPEEAVNYYLDWLSSNKQLIDVRRKR